MLFEYQDILQLHANLRNVIHKEEVLEWIKYDKIQSHLFLSMCETIHNDIHQDALFGLCKKFQFVRPVARRALKNFMAQYTQVKAGRPVEGYQISETRQWNHDTRETILALREEQYEPTDAILKCVKDMIQHDLHMKAMFDPDPPIESKPPMPEKVISSGERLTGIAAFITPDLFEKTTPEKEPFVPPKIL